MKSVMRSLAVLIAALSLLWIAALARDLRARDAQRSIAEALSIDKPERVRIKNISEGMGDQAIVEATIDAAFRLVKDKDGKWKAVEARAGDRQWESLELIHTAVRKEKLLRTTADLRTLATALAGFEREHGFYVAADTCSELIDHLAPKYIGTVLMLDAWSNEFQYRGTRTAYRLSSLGPDGKPDTGDDIVIENGQLVKGTAG
ncbi:MAG TPA: type II secretion system protein GspG [Blastocatellia bacterium]|nr:type II secretion system protein GspG [Blastocatellia bacterium]